MQGATKKVGLTALVLALTLMGCMTTGEKKVDYGTAAYNVLAASRLTYEDTLSSVAAMRDMGLIDPKTVGKIRAIGWDFWKAHQAASQALAKYWDMKEIMKIPDKTDLELKVSIMSGFLADLLEIARPLIFEKIGGPNGS